MSKHRILNLFENPFWSFVWPLPSRRTKWDGKDNAWWTPIFRRQWMWWGYFWKYYWCRIVGHLIVEGEYKFGGSPQMMIECRRCLERFAWHRTCEEDHEHGVAHEYYVKNWIGESEKWLCDDCYMKWRDLMLWEWKKTLKRIRPIAVMESGY